MGICKCRKRTQQFCFVHRKPVCTACILDHPTCVVAPYLEWLKDSDYHAPHCSICREEYSQHDATVRLCCNHVFHPACIQALAEQQPPHTAQAGYTCPTCSAAIIPSPEDETELALALKGVLEEQPWAKAFLSSQPVQQEPTMPSSPGPSAGGFTPASPSGGGSSSGGGDFSFTPVSRKAREPGNSRLEEYPDDEDKDKYRRRGAAQLMVALGIIQPGQKGNVLNSKRLLMIFLLVSLLLLVWVLIKSAISGEDDADE